MSGKTNPFIVKIVAIWTTAFIAALVPRISQARVYDLFRSDYPKGAFCSVIGGACAADDSLESGFFQNPASLVVGKEHFGFDVDYNDTGNLEPGMKGGNDVIESQYMGGIGTSFGGVGIGLGMYGTTGKVKSKVTVTDDLNIDHIVTLETDSTHIEFNLPVGYRMSRRLSLGAGVFGSFTNQNYSVAGNRNTNNQTGLSLGFVVGGAYEISPSLRFGTWFRSPVNSYTTVNLSAQAFATIVNFSEDYDLRTPLIFVNGVNFHPWKNGSEISFDLDLIGSTNNGYLLTYDSFSTAIGDRGLKRKGKNLALEPRLGFKSSAPWSSNNKQTIFFGTYIESARREALPARGHLTGGYSYRLGELVELMAGIDYAKDFFQLFLTFR